MDSWYIMYANEENAEKGKCSYTRYNYFQRINFKQKNSDGKPLGFMDKELTKPLTPRLATTDIEIYVSIILSNRQDQIKIRLIDN